MANTPHKLISIVIVSLPAYPDTPAENKEAAAQTSLGGRTRDIENMQDFDQLIPTPLFTDTHTCTRAGIHAYTYPQPSTSRQAHGQSLPLSPHCSSLHTDMSTLEFQQSILGNTSP